MRKVIGDLIFSPFNSLNWNDGKPISLIENEGKIVISKQYGSETAYYIVPLILVKYLRHYVSEAYQSGKTSKTEQIKDALEIRNTTSNPFLLNDYDKTKALLKLLDNATQ